MSTYVIATVLIIIFVQIYRRYVPVCGIQRVASLNDPNTFTLDIRAYNEIGYHKQSDLQIPYAYLKRHRAEIPEQKLHIIANDRLELNLGLRFLVRNGYRVTSYEIVNSSDRKK